MSDALNTCSKEKLIEKIEQLERQRKYGLVWEDKPEDVQIQCETMLPVLEEVSDLRIDSEDKTGPTHILIEGDNYHALSVLQYTHAGKVDVIYIDPPYNTGNKDFIYNDHFVDKEDLYRHSKWLSFMAKRLELAKRLLADDGAVYVSIDDNEYPRLVMLLEQIFGETNIKTIAVKMSESTGVKMSGVVSQGRIPKLKEYLVIAKPSGIRNLYLEKLPKGAWDDEYRTLITNATEDEVNTVKQIRDNESRTQSDVERCNEIVAHWDTIPLSEYFREAKLPISSQTSFKFENAWRIAQIVTLTGGGRNIAVATKCAFDSVPTFFTITTPQKKLYLVKGDFNHQTKLPRCKVLFADDYLTVHPGDFWSDIKTTGLDNEGGVDFKNGKKPLKLIERVIRTSNKKDAVVLDFFAGSGTTGEAVMRLNQADGGSRQFILSTTGIEKELEGVNIASDIAFKRIRRSISGQENVRYYKTGFVPKGKTNLQTKNRLLRKCDDIIAVREGVYEVAYNDHSHTLLESDRKDVLLVFDVDDIPAINDKYGEGAKPLSIYVFSLTNYSYEAEFDMLRPHTLCPVPESLLEVYRKTFRR